MWLTKQSKESWNGNLVAQSQTGEQLWFAFEINCNYFVVDQVTKLSFYCRIKFIQNMQSKNSESRPKNVFFFLSSSRFFFSFFFKCFCLCILLFNLLGQIDKLWKKVNGGNRTDSVVCNKTILVLNSEKGTKLTCLFFFININITFLSTNTNMFAYFVYLFSLSFSAHSKHCANQLNHDWFFFLNGNE